MNRLLLVLCFLAFAHISFASKLVEISPVRDNIVMLHFDDGYVEHYGLGEDGSQDRLVRKVLPTRIAMEPESYSISSSDDPNYSSPRQPQTVGRKSKGKDFTSNWGQGLPYVSEHFVYLVLPQPMKQANTYEFKLNDRLAENGDAFTLRFEVPLVRSETIHVNQIGYAPAAPVKLGYLSHWMGDLGPLDLSDYKGQSFYLFDVISGEFAYEGQVKLRKALESGPDCAYDEHAPYGSFTGADVYVCDFSGFKQPGEYVLVVDNLGTSYPFRIDDDVYREPFYNTIRALYHNRCGTALEAPYTKWTRGRCHHPAETDTVILSEWRYLDGRNAFEELPQYATDEKRPYFGGWHDAADWDRHHGHLNACQYLMLAYELRPGNFSDDELNIPESGNGIPDILDEVRWCVDFYKSMQEEDGGIHGGIETHRHPGTGISSVTDTDQWYAYAPDPIASMHYAAVACQTAFCMELAGFPEFKSEYIESARRAYTWGLDNTYASAWDEMEFRDMRQFAAAWLFKVTGEEQFQEQFKQDNMIKTANTELELWNSHDQQWAVWTYVLTDLPNIDQALKNRLEQATIQWAYSDHIDNADRRGYRYGNDWWMPVQYGQATRPRVFPVTMAYAVSGDEKFLSYHYTTVDYILGANPLNMCWVTGIGEKSPTEIMHLDSWYYNQERGPVPGFIPYGPAAYTDDSPDGPWEQSWGLKTTYPDASAWPSHELWFENRYCPSTAEFTVQEQIGPAAAAFGFLCAKGGKFTQVAKQSEQPVATFELFPAFPNPFNATTTITFQLETSTKLDIAVFDITGRRIRTLAERRFPAGAHRLTWNGQNDTGQPSASGLYYLRMLGANEVQTRKMILLK